MTTQQEKLSGEQIFNREFHNNNNYFYTLSPTAIPTIQYAFQLLAAEKPELLLEGAYYEFGLFKGFMLWYAENAFRHLTGEGFKFYGFDSFEGLPSDSIDEHEWWLPGNYTASREQVMNNLKLHGANMSRIHLCQGWFSAEVFSKFAEQNELKRMAIVNIDSDMYESCMEVFKFFGDFFEIGTILLFDEIRNVFPTEEEEHGENKAVREYLSTRPSLKLTHLIDYGTVGSAFQVTGI